MRITECVHFEDMDWTESEQKNWAEIATKMFDDLYDDFKPKLENTDEDEGFNKLWEFWNSK